MASLSIADLRATDRSESEMPVRADLQMREAGKICSQECLNLISRSALAQDGDLRQVPLPL